jgi:Ca2+-binding EF-hand superfamily protein
VLRDIYQVGKLKSGPAFNEWLCEDDLEILLKALSRNKTGSILYDDFLSFAFDVEESDEVIEIHEKIRKEIFGRSKLNFTDLVKSFSTSKNYSKGFVRNSEFKSVVRKISSRISSKDVDILVSYWDTENEGTIDFQSFAVWAHTGHAPDDVS